MNAQTLCIDQLSTLLQIRGAIHPIGLAFLVDAFHECAFLFLSKSVKSHVLAIYTFD